MTQASKHLIASIYSQAESPQELARLRQLEDIYKKESIDKLSSIWILNAKLNRILDKLNYGKN